MHRAHPCEHWDGTRRHYCHTGDRVRAYLVGPRCPKHTPAAVAGQPEPPAGTQRPALPPSTPDRKKPTVMPNNTLLTAALAAAARGWQVFPLRPDDKRPAVRDWETRATTDPDRIRRCWSAGPYGVGVACGPSALIVVDLDQPKPGHPAPDAWTGEDIANGSDVFTVLCVRAGEPFAGGTYTVMTGRGGTHLYFRHPADGPQLRNTAGALGWLIDTRGHGGYVVAAGSTVAGRPYTVIDKTDPAALPGWLPERLRPAPPRPVGPVVVELPTDRRGAYLRAALDRTLSHLAEAREGGRNHALFMAAQTLGQLVAGAALGEDDVTAVLTQQARAIGLGEHEADRTICSGLAAGARRPRVVAA
jgi:Bifunctional DNA primase/polymerase, N-terminal